jgi:hypothetical protein
LLGSLKNGESQTFEIEEDACKIISTFRGPGKNQFFDCFKLPEGSEDWYLSGQCNFNPGAGNAFLFDNVTDEEILAHRKQKGKKSIWVTIGAVLLGITIGLAPAFIFGDKAPDPKTFHTDEFSITLTENYKLETDEEFDNFNFVYASKHAVVSFYKEEFSLMQGLQYYTPEVYAEFVLKANNKEGLKISKEDNFSYFEYEEAVDGETYYYLVTMHKSHDAFWIVQYATPYQNRKNMKDDFIKATKSIIFNET